MSIITGIRGARADVQDPDGGWQSACGPSETLEGSGAEGSVIQRLVIRDQ
jgi:hypothetical protein